MEPVQSCAYWIPIEFDLELDRHLESKSGALVARVLRGAIPLHSDEDQTVLMGDLLNVLSSLGVEFESHVLGNEWRGFPGTVIAKVSRLKARELSKKLETLRTTMSVAVLAQHEEMCLFLGDTRRVQSGLDMLAIALEVPDHCGSIVVRMN